MAAAEPPDDLDKFVAWAKKFARGTKKVVLKSAQRANVAWNDAMVSRPPVVAMMRNAVESEKAKHEAIIAELKIQINDLKKKLAEKDAQVQKAVVDRERENMIAEIATLKMQQQVLLELMVPRVASTLGSGQQ